MDERDWDAVAARFEEEIFNVPANDRKGLIRSALLKYATPDAAAADVGCGTGRTIPLLADHYAHVHGLDISSECLQVASYRNRGRENVTYHHADLAAGRVPCPPVDVALCINVLLLASRVKRQRMFRSVCGLVRPGGHLVLVVPSIESVLLTHHMHRRWRDRSKLLRTAPETVIAPSEVLTGIVRIDKVPTKHYLKEELEVTLATQGLRVLETSKIEYPWTTEFPRPPKWMKEPGPWDWLVVAERER